MTSCAMLDRVLIGAEGGTGKGGRTIVVVTSTMVVTGLVSVMVLVTVEGVTRQEHALLRRLGG